MWVLALACRSPDGPKPDVGDGGAHSAHTGVPHVHETGATAHTGGTPPAFDGPWLLSEAGLYADLGAGTLAPGVVATTPRYPLWSDGSEKARWVRVPAGGVVDTRDPDHWVWPVGTLAFKEFVVGGQRVETRRLEKTGDGWDMVGYLWRADGTDADAVPDGAIDVWGTTHDVPDQEACARCHVGPADLILGVDAIQLDDLGQAALPLSAPTPATVPGDPTAIAALGYLHGNCGGCHREGSFVGDRVPLRLDVRVGDTDPLAVGAVVTGVDAPTRHEIGGTSVSIAPGDPDASQLWFRMGLRDLEAMPPIGSEVVDADGRAAIAAWILAL